MNINTLAETIELFNNEIVETGFQRDIQDYINSLDNNQDNIIALRDIADKILIRLNSIYSGDLPDYLKKLFAEKVKPFTDYTHDTELNKLIKDPETNQEDFYYKLNEFLSKLDSEIEQNITEINRISTFIRPYIEIQEEFQSDEQKAIISIIFKEIKATTILKEFNKNLQAWNKILPIYHQIIKSSSPEDIEIVNIQNGSIDFLINIDFDIALELTEVFKIGFKCFMAYLSYKKLAKPIIDSYFGNKKLIASEKEREKELINNIGEAVKTLILEQHKNAIKKDNKIDGNIDKKVEEVVKLVTSHILKGNDLKLLAIPAVQDEVLSEEHVNHKEELRTISSQVRQAMKIIPSKEMKALLEKYNDPDE